MKRRHSVTVFLCLLGQFQFWGGRADCQLISTDAWTAVGSTGVVDESALSDYSADAVGLGYAADSFSLSPIIVRYNVVSLETAVLWNTLELGYVDRTPSASIVATLYQVSVGSGERVALCSSTSVDTRGPTTSRCVHARPDFRRYLYYVEVVISRNDATAQPRVMTLRDYFQVQVLGN